MFGKRVWFLLIIITLFIESIVFSGLLTSCASTETSVKSSYISLLQPQNGDYVYKTLHVLFTVNNIPCPIIEIRLYVDNVIIAIQRSGQFKFEADVSSLKNQSKHAMFIEIVCDDNDLIRSNTVMFYIEKDSVQYGINEIKYENPLLTIDGKPIDNANLGKVELYVDGKLVKLYTNEFDSFFIDLSKYSKGDHDIMIIIYDSKGNMKIIRGLSVNTLTEEITYRQMEDVPNNMATSNEQESEKIINYPKILYPQKGYGLLADNLYIILDKPTDWTIEISDNPFFENILYSAVGTRNIRNDFSSLAETNIYYIRFVKNSLISQVYTIGFIKNTTIKIDGASFSMGSNVSGNDSEKPGHTVSLSDYYISKYEITNHEFYVFLKSSGYKPESRMIGFKNGEEMHPVSSATWYDAAAFCNWLGVRLPTEAEWEYAAKTSNNYLYSWGNEQKLSGNLAGKEDGYLFKSPIGKYPPNDFGLYDMSGNVWEWCMDWYDKTYYKKSVQSNPKGPAKGTSKVVRGGSFFEKFEFLKTITRGGINPHTTFENVGFRIALNN